MRANGGVEPAEWTVEMAPSTVTRDRLEVLLEVGVTRFSMGVQSFSPELLEALGRIHTRRQVDTAVALFKDLGIENFNIDLIFAIPGQTLEMWAADLETLMAVEPAHISTYCLTFEEDTALWLRLQRGQVRKSDVEEEALFFTETERILGAGGFEQYEISNYSRPGRQCLHNVNTWRMYEWMGLGPSAASQYGGRRWTEPHDLDKWLSRLGGGSGSALDEVELTPQLLLQDSLIFGLRMNSGVDMEALAARFGELPEDWAAFEADLLREGLALREGNILRLSASGRLVADRIGEEILLLEDDPPSP